MIKQVEVRVDNGRQKKVITGSLAKVLTEVDAYLVSIR